MGNCIETKRRSFVARKYGVNRSFDREEPMFSPIKRSQSDVNYRSGKVEQSLPRKKDISPIFIDSEDTANQSIRKRRKVETPKSTELNNFMRPVLMDVLPEQSVEQNQLGMVSVANISLDQSLSRYGENARNIKTEARPISEIKKQSSTRHNTSNLPARLDEIIERSIMANKSGQSEQLKAMYFHSQKPPKVNAEVPQAIKPLQLNKEYFKEKVNAPSPQQQLNPEIDRIDEKALKDIEINIHLEPPHHPIYTHEENHRSYPKPPESKLHNYANQQNPSTSTKDLVRKVMPSLSLSQQIEEPIKSSRVPHLTPIFRHDRYFSDLEPKPELQEK